MVRCLLNFCPSACLAMTPFHNGPVVSGSHLPRHLCENFSWRTCIKSCDIQRTLGDLAVLFWIFSFCDAFRATLMSCSPHDKISIESSPPKLARNRDITSNHPPTGYLSAICDDPWWCSHFLFHFRKAHPKAALKNIGAKMSPCLIPCSISKTSLHAPHHFEMSKSPSTKLGMFIKI